MQLKAYQQRALKALRVFLDQSAIRDHAQAYAAACAIGVPGAYGAAYRSLPGLPGVPYCCLRLPTGGGKTLLAAHAIGVARDTSLVQSFPVVLWLVTSTTIAEQTLGALKTVGHPYRQALEATFGGAVRVYNIDERRQLRPQDMAEAATVIVATVQSFRVKNVSDRNVYRDDEELEAHFAALSAGVDLARHEGGPRRGKPIASFANLLRLHRPLVIVDEAQNFIRELSHEMFGRLAPAAVVEFTATPVRSNVIVSATAAELKSEDMIKLPIHLSQHGSWQAAIAHAVDNRAWLEGIAAKEAKGPQGGIRPIALYQAMPAREGAEATVDVVRRHLVEDCRIPEERIAVATGTQRELDGIDLFDPSCLIEHVITVDALREGWDCSFAYVFCSLASIRSGGAVEQLLGRVLRMPFAQRRSSEELNRAYAHVSERNFLEAAEGLKDRLTEMGFDERTALEAIVEQPAGFAWDESQPLPPRPALPVLRVPVRPDQGGWTPEMVAATRIAADGDGGVAITLDAAAPDDVLRAVASAVAVPATAVEAFIAQRAAALSPAEQGAVLRLPRLAIERDGQVEIVFPETLVDVGGWDLGQVDPGLDGFVLTDRPDTFELDVEGGRVVYSRIDATAELALDDATDWDVAALSRWLDRATPQRDVAQPIFLEYCRRVVAGVAGRIPLAQLVRGKHALRRAIVARVVQLRREAGVRGVQQMLGDLTPVLALGENGFSFSKAGYDPRIPYSGSWRPRKHLFAQVGDLKHGGEEFQAAMAIDGHARVRHWVRNVDRTRWSYSLPTSTDQFYPDFVAELTDGRMLIVEYKGADRTDNADSLEKRNIGARMQEVSGGSVVFLWAERDRGGGVARQIDAAIG